MSAPGSRLFRVWMRLLPSWFRAEYGAEMVADYERRYQETRAAHGRLSGFACLVRAFVDVPFAALEARRLADAEAADPLGEASVGAWLDDGWHAMRSLLRAPGWTATALLILTLGIGGTAAVFSVLNAVLLRPLPYENPESLASLWTINQRQGLPDGSSWENTRDWVERSPSLEDATMILRPEFSTFTVTTFGEPERIHVGMVGANFFDVLGVQPTIGRVFEASDPDEDAQIAVLAEWLWVDRFGADPAVLGSTLTIDEEAVRVVGVVSGDLTLPRRETGIWQLLDPRAPDDRSFRGWDAYWVVARLADDATIESAQAELDPIAATLAAEYPDTNRDRGVRVTSLRAEIVGDRLPLLLWTLFGSMILVLAIGGTNVAQLMLSRSAQRRRELAVRASLGASRRRINRQLLLEGTILSLAAGAGGVALAWVGLQGLLTLVPPETPLTQDVGIDGSVLLLSFCVAAVVAPLVGLLPALATSREGAADVLRGGGRSVTASDRRTRSTLVVVEVALAVVLLASAGLLLRSAVAIQAVDPGFPADQTLMARVHFSSSLDETRLATIQEDLLTALRRDADVLDAAIVGKFFIERFPDQTINIVGDPIPSADQPRPRLTSDLVYPGFFESMGVPLVRGRMFVMSDVGDDTSPTLVNQAWVDEFAEGRDPIGLHFRWGDRTEGATLRVVGVVGDMRRTTLEEAAYPQMFWPGVTSAIDVLVTRAGDPLASAQMLNALVRDADADAAVSQVGLAADRYEVGLAPRRFQTLLFGVFAALATGLAAIGLFAILHDAVASRRREIGIRLALGASPAGVRDMVIRQGLGLSALGLGLGLVGVLATSSILEAFVYGVESTDIATLLGVSGVLGLVCCLASAIPALQATRVAPSETLGGE